MATVTLDKDDVIEVETNFIESNPDRISSKQKYTCRSNSDMSGYDSPGPSNQRPRRKSDLLEYKMTKLFDKPADTSVTRKLSAPPMKRQSSDIASLLSKLDKKFNSPQFTDEVHLKPGDPGYGTPKEGTKTAARGRKAHGDISEEIVKLCQVIWDHGQETGIYCI